MLIVIQILELCNFLNKTQIINQLNFRTEAQKDLSLTSVWDRVPNPNRKCILATSKSCEPGYAVGNNIFKINI